MATPEQSKTERRRKTTVPMPRERSNDGGRVSEADIAARAFGYYCERGYEHGSDVEDWLRAERELQPAARPVRRRAAAR